MCIREHVDVLLAITIMLVMLASQVAYGEIYKWVDEHGNVHFSDQKPAEQTAEKVALKVNTYRHVTFEEVSADVDPGLTNGSAVNGAVNNNDSGASKKRKRVVMYSTQWCGACNKAKKYFRKQKIAFKNYDIEKSKKARARFEKLGAKGVPVILVGKKRMNGFSVSGFNRIYR